MSSLFEDSWFSFLARKPFSLSEFPSINSIDDLDFPSTSFFRDFPSSSSIFRDFPSSSSIFKDFPSSSSILRDFPSSSSFFRHRWPADWARTRMKTRAAATLASMRFHDRLDSIVDRVSSTNTAYNPGDDPDKPSTESGKEVIIPIQIQRSSQSKEKKESALVSSKAGIKLCKVKTDDPESLSSLSCQRSPSSTDSIRIPIQREDIDLNNTNREKSRSPVVLNTLFPSRVTLRTDPKPPAVRSQQRKRVVDVGDDDSSPKPASSSSSHSGEQTLHVQVTNTAEDVHDYRTAITHLRRVPLRHFRDDVVTMTFSAKRESACRGNDAEKDDVRCDTEGISEKTGDRSRRPVRTSSCAAPSAVTDSPCQAIDGHLKPRLASTGRRVDSIQGDGNCFFRALSKEMYGTEDLHAEWRQAVCDTVTAHPHLFRQFVDHDSVTSHVQDMRRPGTWATSCEIYAASTLLQREVYVLTPIPGQSGQYHWLFFSPRMLTGASSPHGACSSSSSKRTERCRATPDRVHPCYLTLCHTNGNHYDLITPVLARCNCQIPAPNLDGVSILVDLTESSSSEDEEDEEGEEMGEGQ